MYRVIEVVRSEGARCESRISFIEETSIGWRIGHVGRKVDGRGVDVRIGGDIRHRRQEVVHHAWIVSVVDRWPDKSRLQNVTPEEAPAKRHIMKVQQGRAIRKHGIDIDIFDVGLM